MDNVLRTNGVLEKYSLERPVPQSPVHVLADTGSITTALTMVGDAQPFITPYAQNIKDAKLDGGFLAAIDNASLLNQATAMLKQVVVPTPEALNRTSTWFHDCTLELIREKNLELTGTGKKHVIDLVKDVFRLVPVHWSSSQVVRSGPPY